MDKLPIGFMIGNPDTFGGTAWTYIWENFREACPSESYWTFYAKHEGAQRWIKDLKMGHVAIDLIY